MASVWEFGRLRHGLKVRVCWSHGCIWICVAPVPEPNCPMALGSQTGRVWCPQKKPALSLNPKSASASVLGWAIFISRSSVKSGKKVAHIMKRVLKSLSTYSTEHCCWALHSFSCVGLPEGIPELLVGAGEEKYIYGVVRWMCVIVTDHQALIFGVPCLWGDVVNWRTVLVWKTDAC